MVKLFTDFFMQYGQYGYIALAAVIALVWIFAHIRSEPGQKISVFFGLAEYTKRKSRRDEAPDKESEYAGRWSAAHVSPEKDGTAAINLHKYDLDVTETDDITGTMEDRYLAEDAGIEHLTKSAA